MPTTLTPYGAPAQVEPQPTAAQAPAFRYPPLPRPPAREAGQDTLTYGQTLVLFVLRENCTVTLSADQLELASRAVQLSIAQVGHTLTDTRPQDAASARTVEVLRAAYTTLQTTLRIRRSVDAQHQAARQEAAPEALGGPGEPPTGGTQPGRPAPLQPPPPPLSPRSMALATPGRRPQPQTIDF